MCLEHVSRREMLKLAGLFTVAGAAPLLSAFNAQAQPAANGPVRIGYLPITDAAPLLVAHNNGFFKDAGVDVFSTIFKTLRPRRSRINVSLTSGCK
jgi:NitT/TauT family transport system substrate-binding protein